MSIENITRQITLLQQAIDEADKEMAKLTEAIGVLGDYFCEFHIIPINVPGGTAKIIFKRKV